jgi:hypothetical protein
MTLPRVSQYTKERRRKMPEQRLHQEQLILLLKQLGDRDKEVLKSIRAYRYLTTDQVRRLHFRNTENEQASLRAASRALGKLKDHRLIAPLERRIGGIRAGSGSYVWAIAPAGARALEILGTASGKTARKRLYIPSSSYLTHTLAVAEVSLRLLEMSFDGRTALLHQRLEPECWRSHVTPGGVATFLKPDLDAATCCGEYEDHWFLEVDLATESPATVARKCEQYLAYMRSGKEQEACGVFPSVVWSVPDAKRKGSLQSNIAEALDKDSRIFVVITLDELESLITLGLDAFRQEGEAPDETKGGLTP